MTVRNDRISDTIFSLASGEIFAYLREIEHPYGRASVTSVEVSKDKSDVIIRVECEGNIKEFIQFIEPLKSPIRKKLGRDFWLFKAPKIRFAKSEEVQESTDIVALIEKLSAEYAQRDE